MCLSVCLLFLLEAQVNDLYCNSKHVFGRPQVKSDTKVIPQNTTEHSLRVLGVRLPTRLDLD